jgi:hypothetical protein
MVTSSAVVGSSAIRSAGRARHRDGDHHALPHAARELMRILADTPAAGPESLTSVSISIARSHAAREGRLLVQRDAFGDLATHRS